MYCANCGNEMNDNADVCLSCGVAVKKIQQPIKNKTNVLAILGFIFSLIFSIVNFFSTIIFKLSYLNPTLNFIFSSVSFYLAIAGFICSIIAYKKVKETGERGKGLALAGIIMFSAHIGLIVLLLAILFIFILPFAIIVSSWGVLFI